MILEELLEEAAYARPGYSLVAFREAGLPTFQLTARVTTLERKPISPIDEACLRAVDAGLDSPADLADFLGLPSALLKGTLASLNAKEQINYLRPSGETRAQVLLTSKGRNSLVLASMIQPDERIVQILYDPLARKVIFLPKAALFRPRDVKEKGWLEIPLCGSKRPEAEDIPLSDIDRVVRRLARNPDDIRELLAIGGIERRELMFLPAVALYYRSLDGKEIQVAFYTDGNPSTEHERAFALAGGPATIGAAQALIPQELPSLEDRPALNNQISARSSEREKLESAVRKSEEEIARVRAMGANQEALEKAQKDAEAARSHLKTFTQRLVRCHEHPSLLREALQKSEKRLLIICPWIRHQVVDQQFLQNLEKILRDKVSVFIGYGLAEEGRPPQKEPISRLTYQEFEKLGKRFPNFVWKFVGNTHRKLLICDNRFAVITSFNWLSFRGDPKAAPRDEAGFLVSDLDGVEEIFKDGLSLIQHGYDHPPQANTSEAQR